MKLFSQPMPDAHEPVTSKPSAPVEPKGGTGKDPTSASRSVSAAAEPQRNTSVEQKPIKSGQRNGSKPAGHKSNPGKPGGAEVAERGDSKSAPKSHKAKDGVAHFAWAHSPDAESVQVVGSFCQWKDPVSLEKGEDGVFRADVTVEKGRWVYKFIVDGQWCYDFTTKNEDDGRGNVNNILELEGENCPAPGE